MSSSLQCSKRAILQYFDDQIIEHMMYYTKEELYIIEYIFIHIDFYANSQIYPTFEISIEYQYLNYFEIENTARLSNLIESVARKLLFRYTVFRNKDKMFLCAKPLFLEIKWNKDNITLVMDTIYIRLIQDIKSKHQSERWRHVLRFNSSVAVMLYTFIESFISAGEVIISVSDLKNVLKLEKKYSSYYSFKQKILLTGIETINKLSSLSIYFEELIDDKKNLRLHFIIQTAVDTE